MIDDLIKKITEQQKNTVRDMIRKERNRPAAPSTAPSEAYSELQKKKAENELNNKFTQVKERLTNAENKNAEQDDRLLALETTEATIPVLESRVSAAETKNTEQDNRITNVESRIAGVDYVAREKARINAINNAKNALISAVYFNQTNLNMYQLFATTLEDDSFIDYSHSQQIIYDSVSETVRVDPNNIYKINSIEAGRADLAVGSGHLYTQYATKRVSENLYENYYFGAATNPNTNLYKLSGGVVTTMSATGTIPVARYAGTLNYIPKLNALLLIGGRNASTGAEMSDVHLYRLATNTWENITPSLNGVAFPTLAYHVATFDTVREKVIVAYGRISQTTNNTTTFEVDINTWTVNSFPVGGSSFYRSVIAYIPHLNKTYLLGAGQ